MAVAAAMVPAMAMADVTVSGVVQVGIGGNDSDDAGDLHAQYGDVRINFAASEDLGWGTGYGNVRIDFDGNNVTGPSDVTKVGLKGDFGDVSAGDVGSPIGKGLLGGDLLDEATGCSACVAYTNSFSGLGVKVSIEPGGNPGGTGEDWGIGVGADYSFGAVTVGAGTMTRGDDMYTAIGAQYSANGLTAGLSYETFEGSDVPDGVKPQYTDATTGVLNVDEAAGNNIGASAYYTVDTWTFGAKMYKLVGDEEDVGTKFRVEATKKLGDTVSLNFRVNSFTDDSDLGPDEEAADLVDYRVQLSKTF